MARKKLAARQHKQSRKEYNSIRKRTADIPVSPMSVGYRAAIDPYWADNMAIETEETRARERYERISRQDVRHG